MAKYTTELRTICETYAGLNERAGYSGVDDVISNSVSKIFDFNFPIFDENYRLTLETKILKHYYTREIAAETVGLWKMWLNTRMNEIMPYFNKLYALEAYKFNPLYDVDYYREGNREGNETKNSVDQSRGNISDRRTFNEQGTANGVQTDSSTVNGTRTDNLTQTARDSGTQSDSRQKVDKLNRWEEYSDTPQGTLNGVRDLDYLTNARHISEDGTGSTDTSSTTFGKTVTTTNTGTVGTVETGSGTRQTNDTNSKTGNDDNVRTLNTDTTVNGKANSTEEYLEHVYGKMGTVNYGRLIEEYRNSLINIDTMIIQNLADLFFNLW